MNNNLYTITPEMVQNLRDKQNIIPEDKKSYIPAGIRDNLKLDSVALGKGNNGNNFVAFNFSDDDGNTFSHTEWESNLGSPEEILAKTLNQRDRIIHILTGSGFLTDSDMNIQASSFEDYINKLIAVLGTNHIGKKVRAKIVYNTKNFTTFPNYTFSPFIEPMSVPKEESKLKEIGKWDKFVKTEYTPDKEYSKKDDLAF